MGELQIERHASHPGDRSLEAYIDWMRGKRLFPHNTDALFTQAEWAAAWKEYWEEGSNS